MDKETWDKTWDKINNATKHLFDGLRNLTIAATVVVASNLQVAKYGITEQYKNLFELGSIVGYGLMFMAFIHFAVGVFFLFPSAKSLGIRTKKNGYSIQIYLLIIYVIVGVLMLGYLTKK